MPLRADEKPDEWGYLHNNQHYRDDKRQFDRADLNRAV